ncbi:hypothetical protein [Nocardia vinacea]|uniref:hypothetical protein n=1 Tax=Nocardia vinacea TaxID=96468 RepID=UPI0002FE3CA1|nr:hypothetical protein [Nocardia vinacea]
MAFLGVVCGEVDLVALGADGGAGAVVEPVGEGAVTWPRVSMMRWRLQNGSPL